MKTIEIPTLEDDLKYASESIQSIAAQAIQSIERLYALRFKNLPENSAKPNHTGTVETGNSSPYDPRFEVRSNPIRKEQVMNSPQFPNLSQNRPDLIDDNLQNLNL